METTGLVEAFASLQTNDSRNKALEALVNQLTPYEWRWLQSMTSARSFQLDIIGQLPVELVAHVFAHLDPATPYRLQHVSKKWWLALQSLHVLKRSLSCWYNGAVDLQGVDYALCKRKAQTAHAFCTGNPKSRFTILSDKRISSPMLSGNTLVWKPSEEARVLYALNLHTLSLSTLRGEAREDIRMCHVSEELMAFTSTTNVFYVSELSGKGRRSFKVPSSNYFASVSLRGRTVACAAPLKDRISIYIWNYDTQQGKGFDVCCPSPLVTTCDQDGHFQTSPRGIAILVQPDSKSILVLGDNYCHSCHGPDMLSSFSAAFGRPRPRIVCGRFSYVGECLQTPHVILTESRLCRNSLNPVGPRGAFEAFVHVKQQHNDEKSICVRKQFDEHLGEFTDPKCPLSAGLSEFPQHVHGWNGIFYRASFERTQAGVQILEFVGTSDRLRPKTLATVDNETLISELEISHKDSFVLINDRYVIRYGRYFFHVLGFEDSSEFPKAGGPLFDIGTIVVDE